MVPPGSSSPNCYLSFTVDAPDCRKYSCSDLIALGGKKKFLLFVLKMIFINTQANSWFLNILLLAVIQSNISYDHVF